MCDNNTNLNKLGSDTLYHLGLTTEALDFKKLFGDIKFIITGGTKSRIKRFSFILSKKLNIPGYDTIEELKPINYSERFSIYKVGPILGADHGMGGPSVSILLNELAKLIMYSGCQNVSILRLGTSGGVGEIVHREAKFDEETSLDLLQTAKSLNIPCIYEKTMTCDGFYENQGRLDGAICEFGIENKNKFFDKIYEFGIRGIEMEGLCFAATCEKLNIKAVMILSVLVNRLKGDQVKDSSEQIAQWENQMINLVGEYIKRKLEI